MDIDAVAILLAIVVIIAIGVCETYKAVLSVNNATAEVVDAAVTVCSNNVASTSNDVMLLSFRAEDSIDFI